MSYATLKAVSNILVHVPGLLQYGTTIQQEQRAASPSPFLKEWRRHVRSFEQAVKYGPNQTYIGNLTPVELKSQPQPWYRNLMEDAAAKGPHGEIYDELTFYGVLKIVDTFELVLLTEEYAAQAKTALAGRGYFDEIRLALLEKTTPAEEITELVNNHKAEGLWWGEKLIGCVRQAHETDSNLNAHTMLENLVAKASGVLAVIKLVKQNNLDPATVDYCIETSEEAVGDMNQRGGGNMAKAVGEFAGLVSATGCDVRGFCAGPAHGILHAAAMVKSGAFKNIVVFAGGSLAKLAMNGRDHVNKNMPLLEDMLGGYALLIGEDDGHSPVFRTDIVGRHRISSGASPQAVIQAIVCDPLDQNGLKLTDIDLYAPELQNPEITVPAGAGDVPLANYKMIAAMAVKRGEIERTAMNDFVEKVGLMGFAPTQGHIPSGVPILGYARDSIMRGKINRMMIIGKGSLFLGRMTDLFDGISIIIEPNHMAPQEEAADISGLKAEIMDLLGEALAKAATEIAGR